MSGKNRVFSKEFKEGVAQRILNGESVSALHQEFQIKRSVLYRWRDAYRKEGAAGLQRPISRPPGVANPPRVAARPEEAAARRMGVGPHAGERTHAGGPADGSPRPPRLCSRRGIRRANLLTDRENRAFHAVPTGPRESHDHGAGAEPIGLDPATVDFSDPIARAPHAAFQNISDAQNLPDLANIRVLSFEGEGRSACDHLEPRNFNQRIDDLLGQRAPRSPS